MSPIRFSTATIASAAGLICLFVYLRTLGCDFVSYDDPDYVLNNPLIRHLDARLVVSAFSESYNGWWMPLTWISLAIDYHFWELNPLGYHLTNILLHSVNTGLVVLIADNLLKSRRELRDEGREDAGGYLYPVTLLLAGLLWGIHPLRVESVAWVTERKDVLNGAFSLASILLYLRYAECRAGNDRRAWGVYLLSLLMFALSLMAKSVSVVLPLMLLVIDWYPLNRLQRGRIFPLLAEKLPFLLMSVAMAIVTIRFTSQVGYLVPYSVFPLTQRLTVSGNALFEYFRLMIYPIGILPFYLIPDPLPVSFTLKTIVFTVGAIFCFRVRNSHPWLPAMLLLFVLPLLPVLALFQNGDQALAARFTYLPSLAPSIVVAVAGALKFSSTLKAARWKSLCGAAALVVLLLYAAVTVRDIAVWQDSVSLWSRVIDLQPEVASYKERGKLYAARGDYRAAVDDFSAAIGMAGGVWVRSIYNLYAYRGEAYLSMGRYSEAVQDFTTAISLYPHPVYYHYRGIALQQLGQTAEANEDFARAGGATGPLDWFERAER
jgi:protein O-mannosyl-transferase